MADKNFMHRMHKDFILNEGVAGISSYIQSLSDVLNAFVPKTMGDARRLEIAKENLLNVRRHVKRLEEKISVLEEENNVLKEKKTRR